MIKKLSISSEKNHSVVFTPSGLRGIVKSGVSVLDAARQLGVDLDSVCGGRGICTKCKVKPSFGNFSKFNIEAKVDNLGSSTEIENKSIKKNRISCNERLGCQTKILGDMAAVYFVSVAAIVAAFYGKEALAKKK